MLGVGHSIFCGYSVHSAAKSTCCNAAFALTESIPVIVLIFSRPGSYSTMHPRQLQAACRRRFASSISLSPRCHLHYLLHSRALLVRRPPIRTTASASPGDNEGPVATAAARPNPPSAASSAIAQASESGQSGRSASTATATRPVWTIPPIADVPTWQSPRPPLFGEASPATRYRGRSPPPPFQGDLPRLRPQYAAKVSTGVAHGPPASFPAPL